MDQVVPVLTGDRDAPWLDVPAAQSRGEYWYTRSHEPALTGPWEEWPVQPDEPPSFGMDMKRWRRLTPDRIGYCGLAGKP